jgi:uncharacterized protein
MLRDNIQNQVVLSLKSGDRISLKVLRFVLSEIKYAEIAKKADLTDDEIIILIRKEIKKRKDAIELFKKAKRDDLVDDEEKQLVILEKYMPKSISKEELIIIVDGTLNNLTDSSNVGKIIGMVMGKVKGQADGGEVAKIVKERLSKKNT